MNRLERMATPAGFARELAATEFIPAPSLSFTTPLTKVEQLQNQSSARNPENANFVLGWGSSEQGPGFRGFNGGYSNASIRIAKQPGSNTLNWYAVPNR